MWSGALLRLVCGVRRQPPSWEHFHPGHSLGTAGACAGHRSLPGEGPFLLGETAVVMLSCSPGHALLLTRSEVRQIAVSWGFQSDRGPLAPLPGSTKTVYGCSYQKGQVTPLSSSHCHPYPSCHSSATSILFPCFLTPPALTPNHHPPCAGWEQPVLPHRPWCGKF